MFDEEYPSRFDFKKYESHEFTKSKNFGWLETASRSFVGGYIRRVTPVPIPNTVVKPAEPMILLQRESRSLPALNASPGLHQKTGALFLGKQKGEARDS